MERNWAGTHEYTAPWILPVADEDDVRHAVREAEGRVHALGTRHSFTDLPDTDGTLLDLAGLTGGFLLDQAAVTVTVAAGTRYGVLAEFLEANGFALHNLGSLPHISVGGATATATHGSGDANGVLTTAVRGIRWIDATGEVRETREGDPDFPALAVGLGAFGVVVAVTLAVQPTFQARQDIYVGVTWDAALADLDAVTGAGYSVSVFTLWNEESVGFVWVKTRVEPGDADVPDTLLDGRRDHEAAPLGTAGNVTEVRGVPGPWLQRLPHFRLDAVPSFGDEIQSEYFIAREDAPAALRAMVALGERIRPVLIVSELRTAAADELWLSGAYRRDMLAIHFTFVNDPAGVRAVLPAIEAALAPFAARPHWAKLHTFDAERIARVHPRLADAREVYERLDPEGRFSNAHLERVGVRRAR
ncbi:FAD-binding protein [Microbacterium sp. 1P10UB]|uniref:FAD-binding protein n=1 Tax=unclassified Microbacterium TaxID=2609290 RepID=UPI00399F6A1F